MKITDIQPQRNNKKRYSVYIDGKFCFGISEIDLLYYKLEIDNEITQEKYEQIKDALLLVKAKDVAYKFIGYKMRTKQEVIKKLETDYNEDVISQVLNTLESYNYINDEVFTQSFVKERIKINKEGKVKIKFLLKQKGIDDDVIEKVFEDYSFDEENIIYGLLEKKIKDKQTMDETSKRRLFDYLIRKGFCYEQIYNAFDKFME